MKDNYDFSQGVHGKYAKRYAKGANVVVLDPEIAKQFPTSAAVNKALREVIEQGKKTFQSFRQLALFLLF